MTPALRNAHRYTWYTLAVVLPLGWAAAVWVMPGPVWQTPLRVGQPEPLPAIVLSKQSGDVIVSLRQSRGADQQQVEIQVIKPLEQANTSVVVEGQPEIVLGVLGARGAWRFDLDSPTATRRPLRIRLENNITRQPLRTIELVHI